MQNKSSIGFLNKQYKNLLIKCLMAVIIAMSFAGNVKAVDVSTYDELKIAGESPDTSTTINITGNIDSWTNPIDVTTSKNINGNNNTLDGGSTSQGFNITAGTHSFVNIKMLNFADEDMKISNNASVEISGTSEFQNITNLSNLTIGGTNVIIDTLKAVTNASGSLTLKENAEASINTLSDQAISLGNNSKLNIANSTSLSTMQGTGLLTIGTGSDGKGLIVQENASDIISGSLFADTLTLQTGSSANFTNIQTNLITIDGELKDDVSRLSATSLLTTTNATKGINLDLSVAIANMVTGLDGVPKEYYVYNQADVDWDMFNFTDASKVAINSHVVLGNDILLTTNGDNLTLTIQESTDRLWKVSENFAKSPSVNNDLSVLKPIYDEADGKMVSYDILDTVDKVYVDNDFTIDLSHLTLDPSDEMGLLIQNLTGDAGKTMTILGAGADQSLVSLRNIQDSFAKNTLNLENVTVSSQAFGLGTVLELDTLNLTNSIFNVLPYRIRANSDAETGTTIKRINSDNNSKITGTISINGAGGIYHGTYDDAVINAMDGANQTFKAGEGLTLKGDGGYLTLIEQMGAKIDGIDTTGANLIFSYEGSTNANAALNLIDASSLDGGSLIFYLNAALIEQGIAQTLLTGSTLTLDNTKIYVDASFVDPTKKEIDTYNLNRNDVVLAVLHDNVTANNTSVVLGDFLLSRYFVDPELVAGKITADLKMDNFNNIVQSLGIAASTLKAYQATLKAITMQLNSLNSEKPIAMELDSTNSDMQGIPAGESMIHNVSMWATPLYSYSVTDGFKGTTSKSDSRTNLGGLALGVDKLFANDYRLGVALSTGYGNTKAKNVTDSENDFNFYGLSFYGAKDFQDVKITTDIGFTYIQNEMTEDLSVFNTDDSKADVDSHIISIGAMAEKTFDKESIKLIPYVGLRYTYLYTGSYELKNSSGVLSSTKSDIQNVMQIPAGLKLEKQMNTYKNWSFKPTAKAGIIASFGDLEAKSDSKIKGFSGTQTYKMDNIDTIAFDGGIGIEMQKDNVTIDFDYTLLASPHEYSHSLSANIKWEF